ncbi:MAG TPA: hypothetical protein VIY53_20440 [Acidobacteriaceae bacterium]
MLTQGAPNLDFTDARTGTCTTNGTSYSYGNGDSCTVAVNFTPRFPGARNGAVVLHNSSGAIIAISYVYGVGTGPETAFKPGPATLLGPTFPLPYYLATDGNGNIYVTNVNPPGVGVSEIPRGCSSSACVIPLGSGWGGPYSVAVDGAGNVYVADSANSTSGVFAMPPGCASSSCETKLGGGYFAQPTGVAVDGSGNVYVISSGYQVAELSPGCVATSYNELPCTTTLLGSGGDFVLGPDFLALDGGGNVYVSNRGESRVYEMPPGCSSQSCVTAIGGTIEDLGEVAVDASGTVYVVSSPKRRNDPVTMIPAGCTSATCVTTLTTLGAANGVALEGNGNLLVAQFTYDGGVEEVDRVHAPSLALAATADGKTSRPKTDVLQNIGNAALTFPVLPSQNNPTVTANFTFDSDADGACPLVDSDATSAGTLAAGASCDLPVSFTPGASTYGNTSGTLTLTDDALNAPATAYAKQSIALSGPADPPVGAINLPVDATTLSNTVAIGDYILATGWAADPHDGAPVSSVSILIDGTAVGNATLGLPRPYVVVGRNDSFSYYNSGWTFTYRAASLPVPFGSHQLSAVISDTLGMRTQLGPVQFSVAASPSWGPPFGAMNPAIDATTRSTTVAQNDNLLVSGWAADPRDGAPVSSVSIQIDGATVGTATLGIAEPAVAANHNDSRYLDSGWTFTYAVASLSAGTHTVSAVAADSLGQSTTLGSQTITVAASSPDGPPFGSLDKAVDATTGQTPVSESDNLLVEGWAGDVHDGAPVSRVSILIDGTAVGNAMLGIARPDVAKNRGSQYANSGWKFTMAASPLSAGTHTVTAVASDSLGLSTQLQIQEITVTP